MSAQAPSPAPALSGEAPLLAVSGLQFHRGATRVLDVPELTLPTGGALALIGPNGSGKTTLLKTLAALLAPDAGVLSFRGRPLLTNADRVAYRRQITMVFQDPLLFDTTVQGNLEAGLKLHGVPKAERGLRVAEAAYTFGIEHLLERHARKLSGGESQRTALARAFALQPKLLLLDEPFASLDGPTRESLLEDLARALKGTGTTAILATHDQMEALSLAETLAVMHQGRIVQMGPAAEVINHPQDAFVAGFVGMECILTGPVTASADGLFRIAIAGQELEGVGALPVGGGAMVGVRPENVTLSTHGEGQTSARNSFPATVVRVTPRGPYYKVELNCGFDLNAFVTPRSVDELHLAPGAQVVATFKATAVHLIRNL